MEPHVGGTCPIRSQTERDAPRVPGRKPGRPQIRDLSRGRVYDRLDFRVRVHPIQCPVLEVDDEAILASVRKTNKVLIVHEDTRTGGVAGEITARINEKAFEWLDGPIMRVTAHDTPVPYAPPLEDFVLPQTEDLVKAARWLLAY